MVGLSIRRLFVADVVERGHVGLAPELVDELGLPEEHDVLLVWHCFFLQE